MNHLLADLVLLVHFAFAAFVVAGLVLTWAGAALGWSWVRNRHFRIAHLLAIGIVAAEGAVGLTCPLTWIEDALRGTDPGSAFVARWIHRLLFYEAPAWVFTSVYLAWAGAALLTWRLVPPRR